MKGSRTASPGSVPPDVLIVGSGPAGSALAILLKRRGWSVTMLERDFHPRPKACGECVNPGAVRALARLGLLDTILGLRPARLDGWHLRTEEGHTVETRFPPQDRFGLGLPRADLDAALADEAVRLGARLHEGVTVRTIEMPPGPAPAHGSACDPQRVTALTLESDGRRGHRTAPLIVGADGLRSVVARAINRLSPAPRRRKVSITCRLSGTGPPRQRGILRVGDFGTVGLAAVHSDLPLWNGTLVVDSDRWGRSLGGRPLEFFQEAFTTAGLGWESEPTVLDGPWCSGPFDVPRPRAVSDGVLLVGDAAGYYDPLTGQGIYRALLSAELAAPVIDRALRQTVDRRVSGGPRLPLSRATLAPYEARLHRAFRRGRGIQRIIEGVVSRRRVRGLVFGGLQLFPALGDALIGLTGDVPTPYSLLNRTLRTRGGPMEPTPTPGR
ncbi:MAG: hypothetical protein BMS9Abin29_2144 [Gemmatimonadota bacterium]|nr:MAG: hypothetical protein BMS9Abin29_2144 [Gemmatimonadota bacterium]